MRRGGDAVSDGPAGKPVYGLIADSRNCGGGSALSMAFRRGTDGLSAAVGRGERTVFRSAWTVGIALVVRVGGDLCRDAGESALASAVETAGSICALLAALPLLRQVLHMLSELMK